MTARQKKDLLQGTLEMLVLKALSLGPMHGYGIGARIRQLGDDSLRVEEGSLYPALHRLEEHGQIASEWGTSEKNRRARFYRLTPAGRSRLEVEQEQWRRFVSTVSRILEASA